MDFKIILVLSFVSVLFPSSFASSEEPILITSFKAMDDIVFDGKWTFFSEWKPTSSDTFSYDDGMRIILRSAHQDNFIYFYVDALTDTTLNKGMDKATICIDAENNKNSITDENDFCFSSSLGNKQGTVFQGNSINSVTGNFQKITSPKNFIGISNISDENNRYSKTPHVSYEFKIPLDLIKRSDNYGFYLSVYDANSNSFYSWPKETIRESFFKIPSPQKWGDIISPDKSLPEINLPFFILMISILSIIILPFKMNCLLNKF